MVIGFIGWLMRTIYDNAVRLRKGDHDTPVTPEKMSEKMVDFLK